MAQFPSCRALHFIGCLRLSPKWRTVHPSICAADATAPPLMKHPAEESFCCAGLIFSSCVALAPGRHHVSVTVTVQRASLRLKDANFAEN